MIPGIVAAQMRVAAGNPHAQAILASLISWWDFEEDSGSVFADAHAANDLTASVSIVNMTTVSGMVGRATELGADNEYVYVDGAANTNFAFGNESFTVFLWHFRSNADNPTAGALKWLAGKYFPITNDRSYGIAVIGGSPDVYEMLVSLDGTSSTLTTLVGAEYIQSETGWDFIAFGYDADNDSIFLNVNGAKTTVANSTGMFAGSTANFAIGSQKPAGSSGTASSRGRFDSIGVMSTALTDEQYSVLFNAGAGLNYADLIALT